MSHALDEHARGNVKRRCTTIAGMHGSLQARSLNALGWHLCSTLARTASQTVHDAVTVRSVHTAAQTIVISRSCVHLQWGPRMRAMRCSALYHRTRTNGTACRATHEASGLVNRPGAGGHLGHQRHRSAGRLGAGHELRAGVWLSSGTLPRLAVKLSPSGGSYVITIH